MLLQEWSISQIQPVQCAHEAREMWLAALLFAFPGGVIKPNNLSGSGNKLRLFSMIRPLALSRFPGNADNGWRPTEKPVRFDNVSSALSEERHGLHFRSWVHLKTPGGSGRGSLLSPRILMALARAVMRGTRSSSNMHSSYKDKYNISPIWGG